MKKTPLHLAAEIGDPDVVAVLLRPRPKPDQCIQISAGLGGRAYGAAPPGARPRGRSAAASAAAAAARKSAEESSEEGSEDELKETPEERRRRRRPLFLAEAQARRARTRRRRARADRALRMGSRAGPGWSYRGGTSRARL